MCDKLSVTFDQTRAPRLILFTRLVSTLDLSLQYCYHSARNIKLFLDHYFIFKNRVASRFSRKVFVNKIIFEASLKSLKQNWRITSHYCWRYRTFLSNFAEFIFCDSFPGRKIFFYSNWRLKILYCSSNIQFISYKDHRLKSAEFNTHTGISREEK